MENLKNIDFYKSKNFITRIKTLTDEEIEIVIDDEIVELISKLDVKTINSIFRNSRASMQEKLFRNDDVQKALILGEKDALKVKYNKTLVRGLENLKGIIKSKNVEEELYANKYFLSIIIKLPEFENRFFRFYSVNTTFKRVIESEEYEELSSSLQLKLIEKLNFYVIGNVLLPNDFREKFTDIRKILCGANINEIDNSILEQLTEEELLFLEFINSNPINNDILKEIVYGKLKNGNQSFEAFFQKLNNKFISFDNIIRGNSRGNYFYGRYYAGELESRIYHVLLHETEDEVIKEKLLEYLIPKIMENSNVNSEMIYNTLKRNLNNNLLEYEDIKKLDGWYDETNDKDLLLTFYQKFNIALSNVSYLKGISLEQLSKVNVKHINKLVKFLEDETQDELSSIYGNCIKMYFIFGYERCLEILNGKYGNYNRTFLDNVSKTDVRAIEMRQEGNKYIPNIDKRFITFMFAKPRDNHFSNMLNNKSSELYKGWFYLYNSFDEVLEKCHNEITLRKVLSILEVEKFKINRKLITPDVYNLDDNDFLENIILGNKTIRLDDEVLEKIVEIYGKMKKRAESSIPYVEGIATSGYGYQIMKFDDPKIFELGYKADCCIRTFDIAHNHLLHAALCRNGRILLIYDKLGDLAAFCPLKRNGNVLIANSIELIDKRDVVRDHITVAFKEAMEKVVSTSKLSSERVSLVCIGRKSSAKPDVEPFPDRYETPTIFEKDDKAYCDTDKYHKKLDIVYAEPNFDFESIVSKDPEVSYMDPRDEIKYVEVNINSDQEQVKRAISSINAVNYTIQKDDYKAVSRYFINYVYYNKDWYIANTYGVLICECLDTVYRAREEFSACMEIINKGEKPKVFRK